MTGGIPGKVARSARALRQKGAWTVCGPEQRRGPCGQSRVGWERVMDTSEDFISRGVTGSSDIFRKIFPATLGSPGSESKRRRAQMTGPHSGPGWGPDRQTTAHTPLPPRSLWKILLQLQSSENRISRVTRWRYRAEKMLSFLKGKSRQGNDDTFTTTEVFVGPIGTVGLCQTKPTCLGTSSVFASNWVLGYKQSYFGNSASLFEKNGRTRKGSCVSDLRNMHSPPRLAIC